ncbi:MAG: DUF4136 domain-containing protein [Bacteroidota bacterium]
MKRLFSFFVLLLLLKSCAVSNAVLYDYNLDVDFEAFSTYVLCSDDFMVLNKEHPKIDNESVRILIGDAVAEAMEARAHRTNVFEPELQAGFRIAIKERSDSFKDCEDSDDLEYWENCQIQNTSYMQETLVVYVAEFATNKVIWQASIPCDLKKSNDKLQPYITELVNQLFDTYPKTKNAAKTESNTL